MDPTPPRLPLRAFCGSSRYFLPIFPPFRRVQLLSGRFGNSVRRYQEIAAPKIVGGTKQKQINLLHLDICGSWQDNYGLSFKELSAP